MRAAPNMNRSLVDSRDNPSASIRLFCIPYAGAGAIIYRDWIENFPPHIDVCPVELPGRGRRIREAPFSQLMELARDSAREIVPRLDKPFALFGHSLGAIMAFELARQLRRAFQLEPVHLFVSGCRAPHIPSAEPSTYNLPEADLLEKLRRLGGTPAEVLKNHELMQAMLPMLRADFEALDTYAYIPEPPLECPITVFGGMQDSEVSMDSLEAWSHQTTGNCSVCMMPGDHFFINSAPAPVLRTITGELNAAMNPFNSWQL